MNNNICEEIKKLNNTLNQFEWGYPDENGKNVVETDNFENYQLLSNNKFLKNKIGTCWDYTNYEIIWFMKHGFIHTKNALRNEMVCCYYVESEDESNHTWLAYMLNDFVYLFESSWKSYVGIKKFINEFEMINYYANLFRQYGNYKIINVWKYMRFPCINMDPWDFMQNIKQYGKHVYPKLNKKSS